MRVLQMMAGEGEGGLEKHLIELSNGLAERGIEVSVLASDRYCERLHPKIRFLPFSFRSSRHNPVMLLKLAKIIRQERADIVHAQANKAGKILSTLKPFIDARLVGTIHNLKRDLSFTRHFDAVIGVSNTVSKQIRHPRCRTIYNGIVAPPPPPKHEDIRQPNRTGHNILWLAVGRLVPAKGFDILIKAFQHVPGHLLIAGSGPEQQALEQLRDQLQLGSRVELLGHRDDVAALMHEADAVVISSRREGFSYVFAEALLAAKPVISTDVPIPNEVLDRSLIAPVDDHEALARIMTALDPSAPAHQQAQNFAHKELTLDAMVRNTLQLYQSILAETD